MRSRERQRANRRLKNQRQRESRLERRSATGYRDLTPYNAVQMIRSNGRSQIELK